LNYFSHYFFDHTPNQLEFNFGILAPDLLRNYSKDAYNKGKIAHASTIYTKLTNDTNSSPEIVNFFKGMESHIERDKSFHESTFFNSVYQASHKVLETSFKNARITRFWFALHVLIEMQLDQYLIHKHPQKLKQFYSDLEQLPSDTLTRLLQSVEHNNPEKFLLGFNRFLESRYLYKYTDNQGIIYGLNRIYHQVGISKEEWPKETYHLLEPALVSIYSSIEENIDKLF